MSEVIVDKLTGKTAIGNVTITSEGGLATQQLQQGIAKCWARVSAGTSLTHGFNVSSFLNNSTGDSTISYTNAFTDAQHIAGNATCHVSSGSTFVAQIQTYSTTGIRVDTKGDADDESERSYAVVVLGELA
jgi:hypothetical protein